MPHRRLACAAVVVLSLLSVGSATAAAAPAIVPWIGSYSVALSGEQSNRWTWHHEATGPCDAKIDGAGTESDTLRTAPGVPAIVTGVGTAVTSIVAAGTERATLALSREGSVTEVDPAPADPDTCTGFTGDGNGTPPAPPGCGTRAGSMDLLLAPGALGLRVAADTTTFTTSGGAGEDPSTPFTGCPNAGTSLPTVLDVTAGAPLATAWIPGSGPLAIALSGDTVVPTTTGDVTDTAKLHVEARLTGAAVAANVTAASPDVPIARSGAGNVTLSCPRKATKACTGTLVDEITGADADLASLPAPVPTGATRLGTPTRFRIAAGHRKRIRVALPRGTQTAALADLALPIVLTETGHKGHRLSYVVAVGHPRA